MTINPDWFAYVFLFVSCLYFFLIFLVYIGLSKLAKPEKKYTLPVSIVIAARNEENRILPGLQSLSNLDYPKEKYEIIFVDDDSEDNTAQIIESYCQQNPNWKLIRLQKKSEALRGKKNALLNGIKQAKGELIFTTDADCRVPPGWLRKMVNYFKPGVSMVLGYSPLVHSSKFYFRLLQFDNLFSVIVSAASTKLGYPFTSVGRNLAYRIDAYDDVGGFHSLSKYRSGDDIHLTSRFRYHNNGIIDFCADEEAYVPTLIPGTIKEIVQQQIRKNSKTFQLSVFSILMMLVIFIYYALLITLPIIASGWLLIWIFLLCIKLIIEFLTLIKAAHIFRMRDIIPFIPLMQLIYPVYLIFFSIIGSFQFYQWKK